MRRTGGAAAPIAIALLLMGLPSPAWAQSYELVWQDNFDGTQLDLGKWEPQIGTGCPDLCGWGNNELEYYRAENATVSGGFLTITAKDEVFGNRNYTSARLRTKNLGDWKRGRFEMRAKMPIGRGLWPAFWMLPTDNTYGTWAASGEIDIMEYVGHQPNRALGTIHYGGSWPNNQYSGNDYFLSSGTFNDDFHEFALEWDECEMRWYVDGTLYSTKRNWFSTGGPYPAPFDQRFHLLLNVAVGGNLPGPPDETTQFPQEMVVDYVRVYQIPEVDLDACISLFDGMEHGNPLGNSWFQFNGSEGGGGIDANFVDLPPIEGCSTSLQTGWGSGGSPGFFGGFGRFNPLDLTGMTHFTMWINPDADQDYTLEINLHDDDDGDNYLPPDPDDADDEFQVYRVVSPTGPHAISGAGWQRLSIPLTEFVDDNSYYFGGNGVFDPFPTSSGGNGQLVNVMVVVIGNSGSDVTFRTDRWAFTQQTSSITGRVWDDADGDGFEDGEEPGLNGVGIELFDAELGAVVANEVTSGDGDYSFASLLGGPYEVRVDSSTLPADVIPSFDPDGIASADLFALDLGCDEAIIERDFGYAPAAIDSPPSANRVVLYQNVPNPFNPHTDIKFELAESNDADLAVYDVSGRLIRSLLRARMPAGPHWVEWDGRDEHGRTVAGGIYYYALRADGIEQVRRMAFLK